MGESPKGGTSSRPRTQFERSWREAIMRAASSVQPQTLTDIRLELVPSREPITAISRGSWMATRSSGTAGEAIFMGGLGRIVVITRGGELFVGDVNTLGFVSATEFRVNYSVLRKL